MSWNYRIVRRKSPLGETYYALHEVYYDDNDITKPAGRDAEPRGFACGEDEGPEGIIASLKRALESCEKYGVLDDPWPEDIDEAFLKPFPEDRSLEEELQGSEDAQWWRGDARNYGFSLGHLVVTTAIDGLEPRIKFMEDEGKDSPSMSISIQTGKIISSSLPAFFRHYYATDLAKWVELNREQLMMFWDGRWDEWVDGIHFAETLEGLK